LKINKNFNSNVVALVSNSMNLETSIKASSLPNAIMGWFMIKILK